MYVCMYVCMYVYVYMRQHTPAYVSIRQHTSAKFSIRQHVVLVLAAPPASAPASADSCVRICTFVLVKRENLHFVLLVLAAPPASAPAAATASALEFCTFVLIKRAHLLLPLLRQTLCFCTSKASKSSTWRRARLEARFTSTTALLVQQLY